MPKRDREHSAARDDPPARDINESGTSLGGKLVASTGTLTNWERLQQKRQKHGHNNSTTTTSVQFTSAAAAEAPARSDRVPSSKMQTPYQIHKGQHTVARLSVVPDGPVQRRDQGVRESHDSKHATTAALVPAPVATVPAVVASSVASFAVPRQEKEVLAHASPPAAAPATAGAVSFSALHDVAASLGASHLAAPRQKVRSSQHVEIDVVQRAAVLGPFDSAELTGRQRQFLALDCEMVGVGAEGKRSALAQVVVVDWAGRVVYCTHVLPQEPVTDYRTAFSGVRPEDLRIGGGAVPFEEAQSKVAKLIAGRILVGHGLINDLKCLMLSHDWTRTRDTAKFAPLCRIAVDGRQKPRRLKHLAASHLGIAIQTGEHDPAEDARAALALYKKFEREWEESALRGGKRAKRAPKHATAAAGASGGMT